MFQIGKIVNAHGVKGDIKVFPTTDDPARFGLLSELIVRQGDSERRYPLVSARVHKNVVIIKLAGIDDMNAALALKGAVIVIPDELALPLGEDEYYIRDLYGLAVMDEAGVRLGELADVLVTGANDVYVVKTESGKDLLVPAIRQAVVRVDLERREMVIRGDWGQ